MTASPGDVFIVDSDWLRESPVSFSGETKQKIYEC
jgi:hypothetical protein